MAKAPEINETFLREVDDELRRDEALQFWQRYGKLLIALVVAGLLALGGYLYWQHRQEQQAGEAGEKLSQAVTTLEGGNPQSVAPALTELAKSDSDGVRASARLALAAAARERGDLAGAARAYGEIASDQALDQPFRDAALIQQVATQFDTLPPAQVVDRLRALAVPGNPYFGSAGEMTAIALIRLNRRQEAGRLLVAISGDKQVPETLRSRAVQLAGVLGFDATTAVNKVNS